MEYIQVKYPERRQVFMDDVEVGYTRDENDAECILKIAEGSHSIRLGGMHDFLPLAHDVDVRQTSPNEPLILEFMPSPEFKVKTAG